LLNPSRHLAIGTTRPFGDLAGTGARAGSRPSAASWSNKTNTAVSMNVSTSTAS